MISNIYYDELPKVMLMLVVPTKKTDQVLEIINEKAYTGNFGDGKVFISPVEEAYTVRTRTKGL